jgi:hypothetical protein
MKEATIVETFMINLSVKMKKSKGWSWSTTSFARKRETVRLTNDQ